MKSKLIIILTFTCMLFTTCYDDSGKAKVRINLGNIPIAHNVQKKSFIDKVFSVFVKDAFALSLPNYVTKVHIGIYSETTLLESKSIDVADINAVYGQNEQTVNYVELTAPAGDNITILVIGEYDNKDTPVYAGYFGYTKADLKAGITNDVQVNVYDITSVQGVTEGPSWVNQLDIQYNSDTSEISWNQIGLPVKYRIVQSSYNTSTEIETKTIVYEGTDVNAIKFIVSSCSANPFISWEFYLYFEPFDLITELINSGPGC